MLQTDHALLRLHVEAVWGVRLPIIEKNEITLLPESARPDWRLYAADLAGEQILIWSKELAPAERESLLARLAEVRRLPQEASLPTDVSREVALRLSEPPTIEPGAARQSARLLTADDYALIEAFWPGETQRILGSRAHPPIGVVKAGRLLSLAHSSRRTAEACELGIDTLPEARRRGYALAATVVWSAEITREGLIPIYSALAENTASLRLAAAAGYRPFAHGVSIK